MGNTINIRSEFVEKPYINEVYEGNKSDNYAVNMLESKQHHGKYSTSSQKIKINNSKTGPSKMPRNYRG